MDENYHTIVVVLILVAVAAYAAFLTMVGTALT